ncbi:possible septum site-determining protein MinE [Prochlorococcus marinus str. NATL1A]|uniref:Cell division topological specificity factor n=2 Tax=Prochlorococcus marinus TaxID=1219 RepID=MINE_PROM1|nr:cell division topological specificity factor MinE [Prochlorococcus marinus]A2C0G6.1 RecName: Full=Cell division topological specificity factor [Prochlorococcus marinus str. NATL1A]ABM74976.1 possible septum site-determining protein MinE [Prochlorococcus marinus str. NATL1A]
MAMTLRDIINKLLRRQPASASTARERLQLVLAHDRSDLSTELLDQMRKEILEVVAKYVEIDVDEGAVSLETEDRMTALVANLPIKRTITGQIQLKEPKNQSELDSPETEGTDQKS